MNRLAHSRVLPIFLAMLLQFALLPDQGKLGCMLRSGFGSCCCAQHTPTDETTNESEPAESHGCCGSHDVADEPTSPSDSLEVAIGDAQPDGEACSCGSPTNPPPATPKGAGDDGQKDKSHGLEVACVTPQLDGLLACKRAALRAIPPEPTGPPLHLLYQVFLI